MKDNLGALLRKNRTEKNISKEELANRLDVSVNTITKWEKNISKPSFSYLILLTKELDLTFDELILGHIIDKKNKKDSEKQLKELVKKNGKYKTLFNVFAVIFVCLSLLFMFTIFNKNNLIGSDANYVLVLVVLAFIFVAYIESLEKANLLEEKNKYRECALFLIFAFIFAITGFIMLVVR